VAGYQEAHGEVERLGLAQLVVLVLGTDHRAQEVLGRVGAPLDDERREVSVQKAEATPRRGTGRRPRDAHQEDRGEGPGQEGRCEEGNQPQVARSA
jgi:hypothetical protein